MRPWCPHPLALIAASIVSPTSADLASELPGTTWQLVKAVPASLDISIPSGIPPMKEYYGADGRLYVIGPDAAMGPDTPSLRYRLKDNQRITQIGERPSSSATVSQPDPETLVVTQEGGFTWHYVRLKGNKPQDIRLEPISVEHLPQDTDTPPIAYDTRDYSTQPLPERLQGVWEVIAHERVSPQEAPTYGHFNDLWVIGPSTFRVIGRRLDGESESTHLPYTLSKGHIDYQGPIGNPERMKVTFNRWGHLTLDRADRRIVLKLMQKDTQKPAPRPPLRITLTGLR